MKSKRKLTKGVIKVDTLFDDEDLAVVRESHNATVDDVIRRSKEQGAIPVLTTDMHKNDYAVDPSGRKRVTTYITCAKFE